MSNPPQEEDGSLIFFRGLFGTGTAVRDRLAELRCICDGGKGQVWLSWVETLGEELARYDPTRADPIVWIQDIQDILEKLAKGPSGRNEPDVAAWLRSVRAQLPSPQCENIQLQLEVLNDLAFTTACEMLRNPQWASPAVAEYWATKEKLRIEHVFVSGVSCFHPSTDLRNGRIILKLEKGTTAKRHALLSHLTLHFQLVHEYVSHVLPSFGSVALSEEFLKAVLFDFYPHHGAQDGIVACLADVLDRERPDEHAKVRATLRIVSALVGREAFSRLLLQIAVTPDSEFSDPRKRSLLSRLGKFTSLDVGRRPACLQILNKPELTPDDLEQLSFLLAV